MAELEILKKDLAELVVISGVNIQKGQRLSITCPVECADFARLCAAAAYEAGCKEVLMRWDDDELKRLKFLNTSMMHEDFMIGSADLEITGITHDGEEIPVFRNGNFVF